MNQINLEDASEEADKFINMFKLTRKICREVQFGLVVQKKARPFENKGLL